eukprot:18796-Pleurochrysis_carterae.AAC.3
MDNRLWGGGPAWGSTAVRLSCYCVAQHLYSTLGRCWRDFRGGSQCVPNHFRLRSLPRNAVLPLLHRVWRWPAAAVRRPM